jgi:cytochrome c-type biogenesis protein CcmH/NrfG
VRSTRRSRVQSPSERHPLGKAEAEERRRLRPASISVVRLDSMGRNRRIVRFILALALAIVGALGAIYVLFFAAGGYYITAVASALILGVGLIWLSDLIDARRP